MRLEKLPGRPGFHYHDADDLVQTGEATAWGRFLWAGLYFSIAVSLSYLTYWDLNNLREYRWVRLVEYIPLYLLLAWAALSVVRARRA